MQCKPSPRFFPLSTGVYGPLITLMLVLLLNTVKARNHRGVPLTPNLLIHTFQTVV